MVKTERGHALVEYAIVLIFFTTVAVVAYKTFPYSLGKLYNQMISGPKTYDMYPLVVKGMMP